MHVTIYNYVTALRTGQRETESRQGDSCNVREEQATHAQINDRYLQDTSVLCGVKRTIITMTMVVYICLSAGSDSHYSMF